MSSEWKKCTLGDFVRLQRGHDLTASEQQPGLVPIMGSAGQNGTHNRAIAKGPGVVVGRSGASAGKVHFTPYDYWPHNTCLYVTDFLGNDPLFTYYLLSTVDLASHNSGSAQPSLNRNYLYSIQLQVPPPPEQRQIAEVLRSLDDRITLLGESNATLEAIAQALFKSWFVDFDPVRAKAEGRSPDGMSDATAALFPDGFEGSELGLLPRGWRRTTVGELSQSIFSGGTPDTRNTAYWNGEIPWFSSGETRSRVITATEKQISGLGVKNSSTRLAQRGDVLIASAGQGFTRGQTSFLAIDSYINQSVVAVRTDSEKSHSAWLFYNLSRRYDEMRSISDSHSSRGSLTTKLLAGMPILVPSVELMMAYGEIAQSSIDAQACNQNVAQTLATLRDTLLPRLISGQLRLPEVKAETMETLV